MVDRHANKVAGLIEQPVSDLNVVVGALLGRPSLRTSENPLGPSVYVRALMSAAEDTELGKEAFESFLALFEKPLAEELGNVARQLLEHFVRHGVDVRAIRRSMAIPRTSWSATQVGGNTLMGGNTQMGGNTLTGGHTRPGALGGSFAGGRDWTDRRAGDERSGGCRRRARRRVVRKHGVSRYDGRWLAVRGGGHRAGDGRRNGRDRPACCRRAKRPSFSADC